MKTCPWCGKEYPDQATNCAIDEYELVSDDPRLDPSPPETKAQEIEMPEAPVRPLVLLVRYVAAICASYFVSMAVFIVGMPVMGWAGLGGFMLLFSATGFCGVFVGTLCLPKSSYISGSIVLLILGLAYYCCAIMKLDILRLENNSFPFIWLLPLGGGGVMAPILFGRRAARKPLKQERSP